MVSVFTVESHPDEYESHTLGYYSSREVAEEMRVLFHGDDGEDAPRYVVVEHPLDEWVAEVRANHVALEAFLTRRGERRAWRVTRPHAYMNYRPCLWRAFPGEPYHGELLLVAIVVAADQEVAACEVAELNSAFESSGLWDRAERELVPAKPGARLYLDGSTWEYVR